MTRQPSKKLLRPFVALLLGFAIIPMMIAPSFAENVPKTLKKRSYPGSRDREYIVHLPTSSTSSSIRAEQSMPLVMVLHGCDEDHKTIQYDTNFDSIADRERFIVVYPYITSYEEQRGKNCWGFWMSQHIHKGQGEVEDLAEIVKEVQHDYPVDKNRTYITGISSGGAMTVAALVAHPELFASGSPTAGEPYSETETSVSFNVCSNPGTFKSIDAVVEAMRKEMGTLKPAPLFIIHSTGDCMVKIKAAENNRDAWGKATGVDTTSPIASNSGVTKGTKWTHKKYGGPDGKTVIETLFVEGLKHGWYGDRDDKYAFSNAPDTAQLVWDFFKSHGPPGPSPQPPVVTITKGTPDNARHSIRVEGTVTDDGPLNEVTVKVELLGLAPQAAHDAQINEASKTYKYESPKGLPDDTYYRPRVTAVDAAGNAATVLGDPVALGHPTSKPPALTIDRASCDLEGVSLGGSVQDDVGVVSVEVRIDEKKWMQAELSHDWSYDGGGLPVGTHVVDVRAMNKAALDTIKRTQCTVLDPTDASQSSDLTAHIIASRIRSYANGFGSADKSVTQLLQEYGTTQPFLLYRARGTDDWYAEISNIPRDGRAKAPSGGALQRPRKRDSGSPSVLEPCCPCHP